VIGCLFMLETVCHWGSWQSLTQFQFGNLRQGQYELAITGQPGGELEGEAADDARRIALVGLVPFAELGGMTVSPRVWVGWAAKALLFHTPFIARAIRSFAKGLRTSKSPVRSH
jgi:hypothetical protein